MLWRWPPPSWAVHLQALELLSCQPYDIGPDLRTKPATRVHVAEVVLDLGGPGQQLLLGAPLARGHDAHRDLALTLLRVGVAHGAGHGGAAGRVGQPRVRHVGDGLVAVAEAVLLVARVDLPAGRGRRGRHDEEARVLLPQEGEVLHDDLPYLAVLDVVDGRRVLARREEHPVGVV